MGERVKLGTYSDHFSHMNAARLFPRVGLDLWRRSEKSMFPSITKEALAALPADARLGAVQATESLQPSDTILVLISDLYEGGNTQELLKRAAAIKARGVHFITLLALSDKGAPTYDKHISAQFNALDIPCFACTPDKFPDLMAAAIKKSDLNSFISPS